MQDLMEIQGIKGYLGSDDLVYLELKTVAIGLGFTEIAKSGNISVKWTRVRKYIKDLGIDTSVDEIYTLFISEKIFYKLCMKAKNDIALQFQDKVADILVEIRKTGSYNVKPVLPTTYKEALIELLAQVEENEKLQLENQELKPKAEYTDKVLDSEGTLSVREIAQDFGKTANWLNKILNGLGVQFKQGKKWHLYSKYKDMGLVKEITVLDEENDKNYTRMKWTQKGREFIHKLLKDNCIIE